MKSVRPTPNSRGHLRVGYKNERQDFIEADTMNFGAMPHLVCEPHKDVIYIAQKFFASASML